MSLWKSAFSLLAVSVAACSVISSPDGVKLVPDTLDAAGTSAGAAGQAQTAGASSTDGGAKAQAMGGSAGNGGGAGCQGTSCGTSGEPNLPQVCVPSAPSCDGNVAAACNADGTAYEPGVDCGAEHTCVIGECKAHECEPSQTFCAAEVVRDCAADGLSSAEVETCGEGTYCDVASATCKSGTCAPNQPACDGNRATTCNANGSGYAAGGTTCAAGTSCDAGECKAHVCAPSKDFCVGNSVKSCADNGLSSSNLQDCGQEQYCDAASATCKDQVCVPGDVSCDGQTLVKCNATGSNAARSNCSGGTPVCDAGAAKCIACGAGTQFCGNACVSNNSNDHCGGCNNACQSSETCSSGNCLIKDGYDCVTADECISNKCTTFYQDADGDMHGTAAVPKKVCGTSAPAGYVTTKDDCCDLAAGDGANIFPGQTKWFTSSTTSCNKGWDYNCSNNVEQEATLLMANCVPNGGGFCPAGLGWTGDAVPACGDTANRQVCLELSNGDFCGTGMPSPQKQGCH